MRTHRYAFLALALVGASGAGVASADEFNFSYFGSLINGSGSLLGEGNGDGSFDITSGELYFSDTVFGVVPNPNGTSYAYSPSGHFIYDNQFFPSGENKVDYYGLLFAAGNTEINIFKDNGDGPGLYTFYVHGPSGDVVDHGTISIDEGIATGGSVPPDVPAPGAAALLVAGGAMVVRRQRRRH